MQNSLTPKLNDLKSMVHKALNAWDTIGGTDENLLSFLFLVKERRTMIAGDNSQTALRLATNQVLLDCIEELEKKDEVGGKILRDRFLNKHKIIKVAFTLNMSTDQVSRLQHKAIENLTQLLMGREQKLREERAKTIEMQLPSPSYTRLFGVDQTKATMVEQLLSPGSPWIVDIVGIGGIGKTSLTDAIIRQILYDFHFDKIIWLYAEIQTMSGKNWAPNLTFDELMLQLAKQLLPEESALSERTTQVRNILKTSPHLIVIDNLEAEEETVYLLEHIQGLTNPSKIILTSRTRPPSQAEMYTFLLGELSLEDAAALIRHHANTIGGSNLVDIADQEITTLYETIGGNPLALKLVVSLATVLPLPQILADLPQGRIQKIEEMYRHVYWKAWQTLSEDSRVLLRNMPLIAEAGARVEQMQAISNLSEVKLFGAIQELVARSLLDTRGTAGERRYGIHRLTETFLRTEIIDWPEVK